jgi:hypothetical protein
MLASLQAWVPSHSTRHGQPSGHAMVVRPSQALLPVQSISQVPSLHALAQIAGHAPAPGGSSAQVRPPLSVLEPDDSDAESAPLDDAVEPSAGAVVDVDVEPDDAELVIAMPLVADDDDVVPDSPPLPEPLDPPADAPPWPLASKLHAASRRAKIARRIRIERRCKRARARA